MKPRLLVISEDIVKIQTLSGRLGQIYAVVYQFFLVNKINLAIFLLRPWFEITLLSSDAIKHKKTKTIFYSQILDRNQFAKLKPLAWTLTNKIFEKINKKDQSFLQYKSIWLTKLWENKVSISIMYDYLSYYWLFDKLAQSGEYPNILLIDNSLQSKLAQFQAVKHEKRIINLGFPSLNFLTKRLTQYFRFRELSHKLDEFKQQSKISKIKLAKKPILINAAFFRQLKTLVPVYLELIKLNLRPLIVNDISNVDLYFKNLRLKNYQTVSLAQYIPKNTWSKIPQWLKLVKKIEYRLKLDVFDQPMLVNDFLISLFYDDVISIVRQGLILSRLYLEAGDNLITKLKPRSIIVAGDVRLSELTLSSLSIRHSIPSLTVSSRTMIFNEETYRYNLTDHFAVTGEHTKEKLTNIGVRQDKIHVMGDPRYDHLAIMSKKFNREKVLSELNINKEKNLVLLISFRPNQSLSLEEKRDFFKLSYMAVKKINNAVLVIKPHPTEKRYQVLEQIKEWGMDDVVVSNNQNVELFDLLHACSVVLLTWSMTGLEAMMLNRPVIVVNPHKKNYDQFIPYIKSGAAIESSTLPHLMSILSQLVMINSKNRKKAIKLGRDFSDYYIKAPDGGSGKRIAKLIKSF